MGFKVIEVQVPPRYQGEPTPEQVDALFSYKAIRPETVYALWCDLKSIRYMQREQRNQSYGREAVYRICDYLDQARQAKRREPYNGYNRAVKNYHRQIRQERAAEKRLIAIKIAYEIINKKDSSGSVD